VILCAPGGPGAPKKKEEQEYKHVNTKFDPNGRHVVIFEKSAETYIAPIPKFTRGFGEDVPEHLSKQADSFLSSSKNLPELKARVGYWFEEMKNRGLLFTGKDCITWTSTSSKPLSQAIKDATDDAITGRISPAEDRLKIGKHLDQINTKADDLKKDVKVLANKVKEKDDAWVEGIVQRLFDRQFGDKPMKIKFVQNGNEAQESKKNNFIKSRTTRPKPLLAPKYKTSIVPRPSLNFDAPKSSSFSIFSPNLPPPGPVLPQPHSLGDSQSPTSTFSLPKQTDFSWLKGLGSSSNQQSDGVNMGMDEDEHFSSEEEECST